MNKRLAVEGSKPEGIRKSGRQALPLPMDRLLQHLAEELAREYVELMRQPVDDLDVGRPSPEEGGS